MTATPYQPCADRPAESRQRAALDALSEATAWIFDTLREWNRRSRTRHELGGLDARMLQDIGLTHAEREYLANKPFWRE